jgi:hypothetical protein
MSFLFFYFIFHFGGIILLLLKTNKTKQNISLDVVALSVSLSAERVKI